MKSKKTLILGASENPSRYSFMAAKQLTAKNHEVVLIGRRPGKVAGTEILTDQPDVEDIHTITLYLSAKNQEEYYDYILRLNPKRIIFNPGAENIKLADMAAKEGIEVVNACTLVMLSVGNY